MARDVIAIFIGGYLPGKKYGGPVTSLENFSNQLCDKYDIKIICSDHDFKEVMRYPDIHEGWNKVGNAEVYYTNERDYNSNSFYEIIEPFADKIKLFYLSGIYYIKMNYSVFKMAKKHNIPVLLAPRGDLMKNTISMKSKAKMIKKLVFLNMARFVGIFSNINFQSTSKEETEGLHHYLGIKDNRIYELPNLPVLRHERCDYKKEKNRIRIVFISRLMIKKNPLLAIKAVGDIADKYQVQFDIYGPLEDKDYWKQCTDEISTINQKRQNIEISYKGSLNPAEAKRIYDGYDCFLFPTSSENYGHVIVESMFSDCPVVLSRGTTPWDDYDLQGGFTVQIENISGFTQRLEEIAAMDQVQYWKLIEKNQKYVERRFGLKELKDNYIEMIESVAARKKA